MVCTDLQAFTETVQEVMERESKTPITVGQVFEKLKYVDL
jgi:hypothetical protein